MSESPGHRVMPNAEGWLDPSEIARPGAYGRVDVQKVLAGQVARGYPITAEHPWCDWQVTTPDGHGGRLSPQIHQVVEHENGTITVTPSIDMSQRVPGAFHGYLTRGVWRTA